jgi:phosphocarrier protein
MQMHNEEIDELCEIVVVENERGLHARAAAKFVRVASAHRARIDVECADMRVSGLSIMGLMMLAATKGSQLKLYASGGDAAATVHALADLVKRGFDEN